MQLQRWTLQCYQNKHFLSQTLFESLKLFLQTRSKLFQNHVIQRHCNTPGFSLTSKTVHLSSWPYSIKKESNYHHLENLGGIPDKLQKALELFHVQTVKCWSLYRMVFLKLASLCMVVASLYVQITCSDNDSCLIGQNSCPKIEVSEFSTLCI